MTWQDASTQCQSLGARLAILDTPGKLDLIFNGLFVYCKNVKVMYCTCTHSLFYSFFPSIRLFLIRKKT